MADHEILLKKCQQLGVKFSGKTRKHTPKRRLMDLGVGIGELTRNGPNESSPAIVSASVSSLSVSADDL